MNNFRLALIQHSMGAFSIKRCWDDLWQSLRTHKSKAVLCCVFALLGVILGITLFCISNYNWWYFNRYNYACKLLYGGFFAVLLAFVLAAAVYSALLCLCSAWRQTRFLCYFVMALAALYFGANLAAMFQCVGFLAVLYGLFLLLLELVPDVLCCFFLVSDNCCNNTFKQTLFNCRPVLIIQFAAALLKLLIIFILLRPLSALI